MVQHCLMLVIHPSHQLISTRNWHKILKYSHLIGFRPCSFPNKQAAHLRDDRRNEMQSGTSWVGWPHSFDKIGSGCCWHLQSWLVNVSSLHFSVQQTLFVFKMEFWSFLKSVCLKWILADIWAKSSWALDKELFDFDHI